MTYVFKLVVNIFESNGLITVIYDIQFKVKYNVIFDYKLYIVRVR